MYSFRSLQWIWSPLCSVRVPLTRKLNRVNIYLFIQHFKLTLDIFSFWTARRWCSGFGSEGERMVGTVWVITFFKPLRHCWYPSKSDGAIKWSPQMTVVSTTCFQSFWVDDTNLSHFFLTARSDGNSCRQELLLVLLHPPTTHLRTTFSCVLDVTWHTIYGGAIYGTSQKFNRLQFSYFKQTKHCKYLVFICYILKELTNKYIYY